MKTAISIPGNVFTLADRFAKRMRMSRSELYTHAVQEYLDEHRHARVKEKRNTKLSKNSVANVSQIITLDKSFLTERISKLSASTMKEVDDGLHLILSI